MERKYPHSSACTHYQDSTLWWYEQDSHPFPPCPPDFRHHCSPVPNGTINKRKAENQLARNSPEVRQMCEEIHSMCETFHRECEAFAPAIKTAEDQIEDMEARMILL